MKIAPLNYANVSQPRVYVTAICTVELNSIPETILHFETTYSQAMSVNSNIAAWQTDLSFIFVYLPRTVSWAEVRVELMNFVRLPVTPPADTRILWHWFFLPYAALCLSFFLTGNERIESTPTSSSNSPSWPVLMVSTMGLKRGGSLSFPPSFFYLLRESCSTVSCSGWC